MGKSSPGHNMYFLFHSSAGLNLGKLLHKRATSPVWNYEQSLFSSKIQEVERKTSERASATVSVTCEWRAAMPRAASSAGVGRRAKSYTSGSQGSHFTLTVMLASFLVLRSSSRIFEEKRDCSESTPILHVSCTALSGCPNGHVTTPRLQWQWSNSELAYISLYTYHGKNEKTTAQYPNAERKASFKVLEK